MELPKQLTYLSVLSDLFAMTRNSLSDSLVFHLMTSARDFHLPYGTVSAV
jgi:hypothetical protein